MSTKQRSKIFPLGRRRWLVTNVSLRSGHTRSGKRFRIHRAYHDFAFDLSYWRLASGIEVDFIVDDMRVAIDVKGSGRVTADHLKGLRELQREHRGIGRSILVCIEDRPRRTEDAIDILPARQFAERLWAGKLT